MQTIRSIDASLRIHYKETGIVWKLSTYFLQHIPFHEKDIVFLFIGTDRSTGDAFGPLTGSHLSESTIFPHKIICTLEKPLHALNLEETIQQVNNEHPDAYIVAIDACLGKVSSIGQFLIQQEPLYPGQAVGKKLPPVGHLSIKGVVNVAGFMEHAVLQSTRLYLPFEMSKILSRAIQLTYSRYHSKEVQHRHNNAHYKYAGH